MNKKNYKEKGQAIVLIAFAIIGLVGLTGLAIDGGNAYAERRHAQNAADTAVVAAALAKTRGNPNWQTAGLDMASNNGYNNSNPEHSVILHSCNDTSNPDVLCAAPYDGNAEYLHIVIHSTVQTFFAPVIGISQTTNRVEAIARAKPSKQMYDGNAVVSLNPRDPSVYTLHGSSSTVITGGGIFVNSSADCAYKETDSALPILDAGQSINIVGTACGQTNQPTVASSTAEQLPPLDLSWLDPVCAGAVVYDKNVHRTTAADGSYVITPPANAPLLYSESENKAFPPFPPNPKSVILMPGVYCLEEPMTINSGTVTGTNITIVMHDSDAVSITGGTVTLSAPKTGATMDLLFYQPYADVVNLNGNALLNLTGTILAPYAEIGVEGGAGSQINGQIIGDTVDITGGSGTQINYDDEQNMDAPPQIELIQ